MVSDTAAFILSDGSKSMNATLDLSGNNITMGGGTINMGTGGDISNLDQIQSDFVTLFGSTPTFRISGTGVHDISDNSGVMRLSSDSTMDFLVDTNVQAGFFRAGTDANLRYFGDFAFPNNRDVVDKKYVDDGDASDARIKTGARPFTGGLDTVLSLEPKRFEWRDHPHRPKRDMPGIGLIGQDVAQAAPDLVTTKDTGDTSTDGPENRIPDFHMVHYNKLTLYLVNAVKELHGRVKELEDGA